MLGFLLPFFALTPLCVAASVSHTFFVVNLLLSGSGFDLCKWEFHRVLENTGYSV